MPKPTTNTYIIISPNITQFHYSSTPHYSLEHVIDKLKKNKTKGIIRRYNEEHNAVAVQFPNMKEFLWFKIHEVKTL